ncbi:hypothetical protein N656DRAFT_330312 [Canariomyces notabilis]|uniref:Uncharacterized protein n=1 Tax=Canariomyces notabilis TaxID=2074819 RepID=A0AAN6T9C1_9PEZI|nr:hypothetical protein N656DRAFT_330312 [Canariomyces arenarius]
MSISAKRSNRLAQGETSELCAFLESTTRRKKFVSRYCTVMGLCACGCLDAWYGRQANIGELMSSIIDRDSSETYEVVQRHAQIETNRKTRGQSDRASSIPTPAFRLPALQFAHAKTRCSIICRRLLRSASDRSLSTIWSAVKHLGLDPCMARVYHGKLVPADPRRGTLFRKCR